jgi:hypothetical protein
MKELWFRSKDHCSGSIGDGDALCATYLLRSRLGALSLHLLGVLGLCFIIRAGGGDILNVVTLLEASSKSSIRSMLSHAGQWIC